MELLGQVERITFRNEENGFTVLKLRSEDRELHSALGSMPSAREGENLRLSGDFDLSEKFGRQFKVSRYESVRPTTIEGIRALLSSGFVDGIGPHIADLIVNEFGAKTFEILDNEPDKLLSVKGVGKRKLPQIKSSWHGHRHLTELTLFLQGFGVSAGMIAKIHKTYGDRSKDVIQKNPYIMINDIWGVGFHKADAIAKHFGFDHNSPGRRRAGIFHTLSEASGEGHVMLPQEDLVRAAASLLECDEPAVAEALANAAEAKEIVVENHCCYTPLFYKCEKKAAKLMLALL